MGPQMRDNTFLTTLLVAIGGMVIALFVFFPGEASLMTGSVRRMIDPKRPDLVRLEYITANPELSRGWRTLRVVERPEQCLLLLDHNHAHDPHVPGPLGSLRCVSYRKNDEMIEVLQVRRIAPDAG
jgi:hypothetical protein